MLPLSVQTITEKDNLKVICNATHGNPETTTFFWTGQGLRQNGTTLQIPNIQRNMSGIYSCTAGNTYKSKEKGNDTKIMVVNVLCKY